MECGERSQRLLLPLRLGGFISQSPEEAGRARRGWGPFKTGSTIGEKENKTDLGGEQEGERVSSHPMQF